MNKWQPIATAPKDGTEILAYRDGDLDASDYLIVQYDDDENKWWSGEEGYLFEKDLPTHWMPLPDPPGQHDEVEP